MEAYMPSLAERTLNEILEHAKDNGISEDEARAMLEEFLKEREASE